MENTKKCACCLIVKEKSEFTKYRSNKDGLYSYCRVCKNLKQKEDSLKYHDRINKYMKEYNKRTKDKRDAYYKAYYKENKERILENSREDYEKTKDKVKKRHKNWEINNKAKRSKIKAKRRSKVLKNGIFYISEKEITKLLSSNCYICQANPSEHLDHIVPISKGGTHSIGNLLGACQRCNLEKGSKTLYEYKRQRATREVLRPL